MGKPTRSTKNEPLDCKYLIFWVSKLEVFTQLPPDYHTLGTRGFYRVRREFLVLEEGRSQERRSAGRYKLKT